jgi:hypothetical protein
LNTGLISRIAGGGTSTFNATAAAVGMPSAITLQRVKKDIIIYIADQANGLIRSLNMTSNTISTLVGNPKLAYKLGTFPPVIFDLPLIRDICLDDQGNLFIAEGEKAQGYRFSNNNLTVIAGNGTNYLSQFTGQVRATSIAIIPIGIKVFRNNLYIASRPFLYDTVRISFLCRMDLSSGMLVRIAGNMRPIDNIILGDDARNSSFVRLAFFTILDAGQIYAVDTNTR